MQQTFFSAEGWESWGLDDRPVIPEGMPVEPKARYRTCLFFDAKSARQQTATTRRKGRLMYQATCGASRMNYEHLIPPVFPINRTLAPAVLGPSGLEQREVGAHGEVAKQRAAKGCCTRP